MPKNDKHPPRLFLWLLSLLLPRKDREFLLEDLSAQFREKVRSKGEPTARKWFLHQFAVNAPNFFSYSFSVRYAMLKNYLKIAFRNMSRNKVYSFINIAGLGLGMACCILIFTYIRTELSFDRYHEKADSIHRVYSNLVLGGKPTMIATTNSPVGETMQNDFPEVLDFTRFRIKGRTFIKYEDREFYENRVYYGGTSTFSMFTFPMLKGDPETALQTAYSVVISESMAKKYFGAADPLGKILKMDGQKDFTVTGVVEDIPQNSHFVFDMLLSFRTLISESARNETWRSGFSFFTYLLLDENADPVALEAKFPEFADKYTKEPLASANGDADYFLQPLSDIHLHSHYRHELAENSDILYIYIFSVIGIFILAIACINFMNLATARSTRRVKEIGIRKVLGGAREQLIKQFYGESLIYSGCASVVAIIIAHSMLPFIDDISGVALKIDYFDTLWLIPGLVGLALVVGLLAGSYPALFLSGHNPNRLFRSSGNTAPGHAHFRKALVILQFAISIGLIVGSGIIIDQLNFMKNKDLGFNKEHVAVISIRNNAIVQSMDAVKERLSAISGVISVASGSHVPGNGSSGTSALPVDGAEVEALFINFMNIDSDYIPTMGMEMAAGRNFSAEFPTDPTVGVILNEAAANKIGWDDPIGKRIDVGSPEPNIVVGVVKDFHYISAHRVIEPAFMLNLSDYYVRLVAVKIAPGDIENTLEQIGSVWEEFDPDRAFDFSFLDESFDRQYRADEKLQSIFEYFTLLAIMIACLGLFGLASYAAEQRTKEIGVRKVHGATVMDIVKLLSKDFALLVLIANVIAWPAGYFGMRSWLENFAYRTSLGLEIFIVSGLAALAIAQLTVSIQTIKAARANPIESLRYE
ncbi:ABC transporter permease [candidate division KSB1 bacterium]